jgi:hypothetical protein
MPAKLEGWESNLAEYLRVMTAAPFRWGSHDCCMHAAAVVKIQTGADHAAELRWTYSDAKGAAAALRKHYRGSPWNVPEAHGLQPVDVKLAQRGDLVGKNVERRRALGFCYGRKSFFVGKKGLVAVHTLECDRAWRVL